MEENKNMSTDDVAMLLVELYADYKKYDEYGSEAYARAVGIAIRMLTD